MNLERYEPWNLLERFNNEVSRVYEDRFFRAIDSDSSKVVTSHWSPAVDIKEESDGFVLHADVPGVDAKEIDISMEEGMLIIKGERAHESSEEKNGYKRVERVRGSFYRRFSLPETADAERVTAKYDNGVLTVTIPKQEKAQPRRIPVA